MNFVVFDPIPSPFPWNGKGAYFVANELIRSEENNETNKKNGKST